MHDIEPFFNWRDDYIAAEDARSPFFGRTSDEFFYTHKVYNYFIHPQWDEFGSSTLYLKVLFADYDDGTAVLEFIGEWNDCLHNDIMYLKREVLEPMVEAGIYRFVLICENVLNFHGSDDCYYEEWYEDIQDEDGWICYINTLNHVEEEMKETRLQYYAHFGKEFSQVNWRVHRPKVLCQLVGALIHGQIKRLPG
ncbi:MAG: hypothetical protein IPN74_17695 [Haliscomenobacter sp.]|nr:hypothetical protein [Haliscomenobacter sp.]MBK8880284.1 hypothetical protein [Haliscomenobacter sp.]